MTLYATRYCPGPLCGAEVIVWGAYEIQGDDSGQIVSVPLLDSLTAVVELNAEDPVSEIYGPAIYGVYVRPDGSEILVEVCVVGRCGDKCYKAAASEDARINVYSSRDDGLTWSVSMTLAPYEYVIGIRDDGRIVLGNCYEKTAWLVPGGDPTTVPSNTIEADDIFDRATLFDDGSVVYLNDNHASHYLVRESPSEGILERIKIPEYIAGGVYFGPRLSDIEQFIAIGGNLYVINWSEYKLHGIEIDVPEPGRLQIVGIRQD